jgi:flagellar basal body-associated protein FliL
MKKLILIIVALYILSVVIATIMIYTANSRTTFNMDYIDTGMALMYMEDGVDKEGFIKFLSPQTKK